MLVLQVTPYYLPHVGGVELHVANLVRNLGCSVKVVSSKPSKADFQVKSVFLPYTPIPITFPKVKADVYHSHTPSPFFSLKAKELAEEFKAPHLITYHNDVVIPDRVDGFYIPPFLGNTIEKVNEKIVIPVLKKAELILATTKSYALTSPILSKFMDKVEIVPNGVDVNVFTPGGVKKDRVVYVGRLVEYKGLPYLIRAMKEVQKCRNVVLTVVGDGEDRNYFQELCRKLGVKAEFTGKIELKKLVEVIRSSKLLVLPSFSRLEAFGIVLLEAMACGTPVAGANVPGVGEIASKAGFVFNSVEELSSIILEVVDNDSLVRKLGKRGREVVVREFSWTIIVKKIEKIYEEVIF